MRKAVLAFLILAVVSPCFAKYSGGTGIPDDPYQIANAADLLTLAEDTDDYNQCFILTADIDLDPNLPDGQVFTTAVIAPQGGGPFPFTGVFDGAGHKITNLDINDTWSGNDRLGLFGEIAPGGEIKNLGLENVSITGGNGSWGLGGLVGRNSGTISNCYSTGTIIGGVLSQYLGGLVGENWWGTISNCYSTGAVSGGIRLGGLVGSSSGDINNCYSTGDVTGGGCLGGLVGENNGSISNCYSTGDVAGEEYLGGLVGSSSGSISNCYSISAVSGFYGIGGLVGFNYDDGSISNCNSTGAVSGYDKVGGLVGFNYDGTISNCYSTGDVTGGDNSQYLGGLVGLNDHGSIGNCYSTGDVTGRYYLGGLVGENNGSISNCYSTGTVTGRYYLGGLVGRNYSDISNCYSTGNVTGGDNSDYLGGLVGRNHDGTINSCYFLITSGPDNGLGTPLTDAQMKHQAGFIGWDFNAVWHICGGTSYPKLLWQMPQECPPRYSGGTGEPNDPYQIASVENLLALAADDYDKHFVLTADINLASFGTFTTAVIVSDIDIIFLGFDWVVEGAFTGVFDGAGHKITNLTINTNGAGTYYLGLFGCIYNGEVKDLGLENVSIIGGNNSRYLGGLVGYNWDGTISNCYSTGAVTGGDGSERLGGLVGFNEGIVINCYSTGTVTGGVSSRYLGGLVGSNYEGTISNCYSTGNVTGSWEVGGLVGNNYKSSISNCYSTGTVTGGEYLGGLAGYNYGSISNCYFLAGSGPNNGYGTPLTDEEMKQQSNFAGWDFDDIWAICETTNYPKLLWQILPGDIVCPDGVDIEDLAEMCEQWLFEEIPADLAPPPSGDGIVDFADFVVFANQWGVTNDIDGLLDFAEQWLKTGLPLCSADISPLPDGDGRVNAADFALMANNWLTGF